MRRIIGRYAAIADKKTVEPMLWGENRVRIVVTEKNRSV